MNKFLKFIFKEVIKIRPKRRRDKDNPYFLEHIPEIDKYIIKFNDTYTKQHIELEISKEIFDVFNDSELKYLSERNEYDRHIEHSIYDENNINKRILKNIDTVEEAVMRQLDNEKIHIAISSLPFIQKKRIYEYFFENLTQKEIADKNNCSIRAIQYSLNSALKNLKNFLR